MFLSQILCYTYVLIDSAAFFPLLAAPTGTSQNYYSLNPILLTSREGAPRDPYRTDNYTYDTKLTLTILFYLFFLDPERNEIVL